MTGCQTIVEMTKNSDTGYSAQVLEFYAHEHETNVRGAFIWFEGEDIMFADARKLDVSADFAYNSIVGKKNVKPEEMASGMPLLVKSSMINGETKYEKF